LPKKYYIIHIDYKYLCILRKDKEVQGHWNRKRLMSTVQLGQPEMPCINNWEDTQGLRIVSEINRMVTD